jgi:hydrogenase-1 operon protein HyaF
MKMQNTDPKQDNVISFDSAMLKKQGSALATILTEIKSALRNLLKTGQETIIDLNNTPCDQECEEALLEILGEGEVSATLTIFGCDQPYQ